MIHAGVLWAMLLTSLLGCVGVARARTRFMENTWSVVAVSPLFVLLLLAYLGQLVATN